MTADPKFADRPATEKTVVYRVLKRYENTDEAYDAGEPHHRWLEQQPLTITAEYPYPTGRIVGEQYGEGDYIILPPPGSHQPPRFLTVVADRTFREAEEAE